MLRVSIFLRTLFLENVMLINNELAEKLREKYETICDLLYYGCCCIDKPLKGKSQYIYVQYNQMSKDVEMLQATYTELKRLGKIADGQPCMLMRRVVEDKQWLFDYDEITNSLLFNEYMYFMRNIPERQAWLQDKRNSIIQDASQKIELNPLIKTLVENVVGANAEWFLKKEAVRFAELCKLKSFDVIITHGRDIGKDVLVDLMTRLYIPYNECPKRYSGEAEIGSKKIFGINIHNNTIALKLVESGMSKLHFDFIKSLQSKSGTSVAIKCKGAKEVNPFCLYAYVLKNSTYGNRDIYFTNEPSIKNSMFLSFNQEARFLPEIIDADGLDQLTNPSPKFISDFRRYMLSLYDSLSDEEIITVKSSERFIAQSAYNPKDYIHSSMVVPTRELPQKYISSITNGDEDELMQLLEFGIIELLQNGKSKENKIADSLAVLLCDYKEQKEKGKERKESYRILHHKMVSKALGILDGWKYYACFTSNQDVGKLKIHN